MDGIVNLLVSAIVGAIFGYILPIWYERFKTWLKSRKIQRRQALLREKKIYDWLIEYYRRTGNIDDLFDCRIGNFETKIPFLTKREWLFYAPINPNKDDMLQYSETTEQGFPINYRLIKFRQELGQNLFNEPTLYLDRMDEGNQQIRLHVKKCDYFQKVTSLLQIEEETFKAVEKNEYRKLPIRNAHFANITTASKLKMKPYTIGCTVGFAIKSKNGYEILLHTRSHKTATYGGSKSVIPNFGLNPITGVLDSPTSLLYYNFVREYCEELYSYDELILLINNKRANPLWFYELPEVQELQKLVKDKKLIFEFIGFGFDGLNGTATIAIMALVNDIKYANKLKKIIAGNWEVAERVSGLEPIEFVDFKSPKLDEWLKSKQYHVGSAFTVSRVLERLNDIQIAEKHASP